MVGCIIYFGCRRDWRRWPLWQTGKVVACPHIAGIADNGSAVSYYDFYRGEIFE